MPGSLTGSIGYRKELVGAAPTLRRLAPMSFLGAVVGAVLLLVLDPELFRAIVPVLILRRAGARGDRPPDQRVGRATPGGGHRERGATTSARCRAGSSGPGSTAATSVPPRAIILMGVLGALSSEPIQRLNGYKNVLATIVNGVAALVFILVARDQIDWLVVLLIAIGSTIGGVLGSTVGRRLPPPVLRGVIVVIGLVAIVKLVAFP